MSMYFITKKDSETGKRFQKIEEKRVECFNAQKCLAEKYGFRAWRGAYWSVYGGMSSCCDFSSTPDKKVWGKGLDVNEFFPKRNSKIGKDIYNEISKLPTISKRELNECVGLKLRFKTIGFSSGNDEFFGFSVGDDWDFIPPLDCKEVTTTEYRNLFNK